jgi:hypothetical protein
VSLAHCFCCQKNINNIDPLISLDYEFTAAVRQLEGWLKDYEARQKHKRPTPSTRK